MSSLRSALRLLPRTGQHLRRSPAPLRLWATTTAVTADGVTAHLQTEFRFGPLGGTAREAADLADLAMDAVEAVLRREIGSRAATDLPAVGTAVDWVPVDLVPGAVIDEVHVLGSDLEVTPQLQRLLSGSAST